MEIEKVLSNQDFFYFLIKVYSKFSSTNFKRKQNSTPKNTAPQNIASKK